MIESPETTDIRESRRYSPGPSPSRPVLPRAEPSGPKNLIEREPLSATTIRPSDNLATPVISEKTARPSPVAVPICRIGVVPLARRFHHPTAVPGSRRSGPAQNLWLYELALAGHFRSTRCRIGRREQSLLWTLHVGVLSSPSTSPTAARSDDHPAHRRHVT